MPDVFTKAKRSDVMSRIRSRGNADTELALVRLLRAHKISGWRRQVRLKLKGERVKELNKGRCQGAPRIHSFTDLTHSPPLTVRPDFIFPKSRMAVFVDGCFWHGCPKHGTRPKGNALFWRRKFAANKARDVRVNRALRRAGWRVLRVWEHDLKRGVRNAERGTSPVVRRIQRAIAGG